MNRNQFQQLINEIIQIKREIIQKLEEIRRGGIDIETEIGKLRKSDINMDYEIKTKAGR